jgi:MFS family permease
MAVFRNRPFLLLWLAQAATQIGGNMVIYGLTIIISTSTNSNTAVSALILTFLVPAVLFSAVAGVYVDRLDRRLVLVVTNVLRGIAFVAIFLVGDHLLAIYLLNIFVSTVTVFFAPAEAAMIPILVPRHQLLTANGIFTITLNAAFAVGFALLGPLVVNIWGAPQLILAVAALYFIASFFCFTLPSAPPVKREGKVTAEAGQAANSTLAQLREGLAYVRSHRSISWSLIYLGIAASLVGVLGVLGPNFARTTLGLAPQDFVVVVLPIGAGIVMGILLLNTYGRLFPRRRVIEGGLIALGILLAAMALAGPISRLLQRANAAAPIADFSGLTSLLAVVVVVAFGAGIAYAAVAIPSQTQLQEDIEPEVRGRVFGVLNMLVSVASFLPIIIVGPIADLIGTTNVILLVATGIAVSGITSIIRRGPLLESEALSRADAGTHDPIVAALGAEVHHQPGLFDLPDPDAPGDAALARAIEIEGHEANRSGGEDRTGITPASSASSASSAGSAGSPSESVETAERSKPS